MAERNAGDHQNREVEESPDAGADNPAAPPQEEVKDGLKPTPVVWISGLLTLLFLLGVYDFATSSSEPNQCTMTYMFEYPQYIKVSLPAELKTQYPKYNLYVYSEGKLVEDLQAKRYEGIPVLFIPGNAGSYKQVRSLASVALRQAIDRSKYKLHFDYFAIDFGEEHSGIYGSVLNDQSRFASRCVSEILKLYSEQVKTAISDEAANSPAIAPESVFVIGHSVGGLIARSMFLQPDFTASTVNTIITLATPHRPVVITDWHLDKFYKDVNNFWAINHKTTLNHVTLVSIGGGFRDLQVRPDLTKSEFANISVISSSAPAIWVSTDHLCIVWCKQLVLAITRSLFDLVNPLTQQLTFDKEIRQRVFHYHLVHRTAGKQFKAAFNGGQQHPAQVTFDKEGQWLDLIKRQYTYTSQSKKWEKDIDVTHLMIRTHDDVKHDQLTVDAVNMDLDDWIFACKATTVHKGTRLCETGDNLSHLSRILPSNGKRKTLTISLKELRLRHGYTHVVVVVPKRLEDARVIVDVYDPRDRSVDVHLPRFVMFYKSQVVLDRTIENAVFYNLSLKGMDQMWQAYTIQVLPREGKCRSKNHFGLIQFVTWDNETTHALIGHNMTNRMTVKLQSPIPGVAEGETLPAHMRTDVLLYLNPQCIYSIGVRPNIAEMWGQMVRFYYPMMISFVASVAMLTFANQLRLIAEPEKTSPEPKFHSFFVILASKVSPMSAVMPCRLLASLLSSAAVASRLPFVTDFSLMAESGIDFSLLPIVLFFVAMGLTAIVAGAAWATILFFGSAAEKLVSRLVAGAVPPVAAAGDLAVDAAVSVLQTFPVILSVAFIAISVSSCGTLALALGTFAHIVHLFSMYKDFIRKKILNAALTLTENNSEEEVEVKEKKEEDFLAMGQIHFQFSMAFFWLLATLLNAPSLLAWTHSLETGTRMTSDPSLITAVLFCLTLPFLWGDNRPDLQLANYSRLSNAVQLSAILTLLYGSLSLYRVNYFISGVVMLTALHQMVSERTKVVEEEEVIEGEEAVEEDHSD